jgi:hypothetical protein
MEILLQKIKNNKSDNEKILEKFIDENIVPLIDKNISSKKYFITEKYDCYDEFFYNYIYYKDYLEKKEFTVNLYIKKVYGLLGFCRIYLKHKKRDQNKEYFWTLASWKRPDEENRNDWGYDVDDCEYAISITW